MEMTTTSKGKRGVGFATPRDEEEEDLEAATTASVSTDEEGEEEEDELEGEDGGEMVQEGEGRGDGGSRGDSPPVKRKRKKVGDSARHTMYNVPARRTKFVPVTLSFENLFYSVKTREGKNPFHKKQRKTLLKDLHGQMWPGELTAIMGPSGAGKTTLLNLLAGREQGGKVRGGITVNDIPQDRIPRRTWSRLSSYIMQDDVLYPTLTPRETLWFAAQLKLPVREKDKTEKIDSLISELGLEDCQRTRIGDVEQQGISGGQRKRVSIGMEMITDPSILFLDEPTSGLDSATAYSLVEKLQRLAAMGRTIVTTIHQPSTDIFFKFDRLILMAEGHIVYNGPSKKAVAYFAKLGYKCPQYTNPAEFILNLVKPDSYISSREDGEDRLKHLIIAYRALNHLSELSEDGSCYADALKHSEPEQAPRRRFSKLTQALSWKRGHEDEYALEVNSIKVVRGPNILYRLGLLVFRSTIMQLRDPMLIPARFVQALFLSIIVGLLYLQLGYNQASITDRQGSLFFVIISLALGPMMSSLIAFQSERVLFVREHSMGSYNTLTYYFAKLIADLPSLVVFPVLQGTITYFMVGYQYEADKYFIFIAACIMATMVAHVLGFAVSAGAPNQNISLAMAPVVLIPLLILGGFFLSDDSVPYWFIWLKYFSLYKYGYQILARNEFEGLTFTCHADDVSCIPTGDDVLRILNLDNDEGSLWASFLFLFMQYFLFHIIAFTLLGITAGRRKKAAKG